jgi:hypothetical protein
LLHTSDECDTCAEALMAIDRANDVRRLARESVKFYETRWDEARERAADRHRKWGEALANLRVARDALVRQRAWLLRVINTGDHSGYASALESLEAALTKVRA